MPPTSRGPRPLVGYPASPPEVPAARTTCRHLTRRLTAARTTMFTPVQDAASCQGTADSRAHQSTDNASRGEAEHSSHKQRHQRGPDEIPANPLVHKITAFHRPLCPALQRLTRRRIT